MARGFWETLLGGIGTAIDDARTKLIDEGWFGRRSMPGIGDHGMPIDPVPNAIDGLRSFEELWAPRERDAAPGERGHDPEGLEIER